MIVGDVVQQLCNEHGTSIEDFLVNLAKSMAATPCARCLNMTMQGCASQYSMCRATEGKTKLFHER